MPIENNLPVIFDTATQTEDGLMSYQDKIKLDNMDQSLTDKLSKTDKISSSQLDTSSDTAKIQPANLSDAVKKMMTGTASVEATVPNNGVTNGKIAENAVTIEKIDKRTLLGNVVSPRPLDFAFDTKKVSITVPQGSLFLTDATTSRVLVTGCDTAAVNVNLNYPSSFDGLNYIVSNPNGTLSLVNNRKLSSITNSNSIMALVSLSKTYEATVVMNGNYTINGLAQGIGTESAALMGTGKIIFDQQTGIIDFTGAPLVYLVTGGVLKTSINSQASIRLANYSSDSIYSLYWDNATSSLKTALATISSSDTDINKIALIKDGVIVPYVNTGIFYSKPYIDAPYYTESFDFINNAGIISSAPVDIITEKESKLVFNDDTYVFLNQEEFKVKNKEAIYEDREGLHYILFDLDNQVISCRFHSQDVDTSKKNIVIGTMWLSDGKFPQVSGNIQITANGKTSYQDNLSEAEDSISSLEDTVYTDIKNNRILAPDELFMINGEELPIYRSSILYKDTEGVKTAISYNKKGSSMAPRTEFFDGNIYVDSSNLGTDLRIYAVDKYKTNSYLRKTLKVNKVDSTKKKGQSIKVLCLGDDLINDKTAYYVRNKLTTLGLTTTMLGTMVNSQVYGEGRKGWFYSTFVGASGRGVEEGKITPQTSNGVSSILLNPFVRVANADDKANKPNDCYRATGAYIEKNYYNDSDKNGAFYIFDFAKYLEVQGIETPDVVIIAIKPELAKAYTNDIVSTNMMYLKQMISGIRAALPNAYIGLVPQYSITTMNKSLWEDTHRMVRETVSYISDLKDDKIKVIPAWMHMSRDVGVAGFGQDKNNGQLYIREANDDSVLEENTKIELATSIVSFIMNI